MRSFGAWYVPEMGGGGSRARPQLWVKKTTSFCYCFYSIQKPSKRAKKTIKLLNLCGSGKNPEITKLALGWVMGINSE